MASESARLTRLGPGAAEPERGASPPAAEAAAPEPAVEEVPEVRARLRSGILAGLFTLAMFYTSVGDGKEGVAASYS